MDLGGYEMSTKKILLITGLTVFSIVALLTVITSWYTVDESEQAVVITFGNADETITDSGLHFKLPWPIQKVEILSKETYSLQFGFKETEDGVVESYKEEAKMITGDENIVLTDLVVQWKIAEPEKYLFYSENPEDILYSATSSAIRSIIGSSTIDEALTDGKADIEADTRDLLVSLIEKYDIGISIQGVKLQDVELPNDEVRAAFTAVTDARETKNTKTNQAEKYKNQKLSEAEGDIKSITESALGEKVARIQQAEGDVAIFNKLVAEYKGNQEITRQRLVIETLENVLPNAQIYIMNDDGDTLKYLPLQPTNSTPVVQTEPTEESKEEGSGN